MNKSTTGTGASLLKKCTVVAGRLCRIASRQVRLAAVRRQRKHYFRNLGERLYVFRVLQREDNVWDKEEISQLLLSLADLDQEQELLLMEINEIRNECFCGGETVGPLVGESPVADVPTASETAAAAAASGAAETAPVEKAGEPEAAEASGADTGSAPESAASAPESKPKSETASKTTAAVGAPAGNDASIQPTRRRAAKKTAKPSSADTGGEGDAGNAGPVADVAAGEGDGDES
ncbi:MAG: hypothetical protein JW781_04900 [Deltaproteobacteria bacterium]|nr:hypothetical protein [Candidatus Anaeroferrophillacea bacterium]